MALAQSDLTELLDAFRVGEGVNLIRDAVRLVLQELIETEATERIGAARFARTEDHLNKRNGHRPRLLATQAGDIELAIPRDRRRTLPGRGLARRARGARPVPLQRCVDIRGVLAGV